MPKILVIHGAGMNMRDYKVNADIAAPFMGEFDEFETQQHG
jgi:hypothetical protein